MNMNKDFKIVDGELLEYYGNGGDVIVPDGVTSIADEVFSENISLTSVLIPAFLARVIAPISGLEATKYSIVQKFSFAFASITD